MVVHLHEEWLLIQILFFYLFIIERLKAQQLLSATLKLPHFLILFIAIDHNSSPTNSKKPTSQEKVCSACISLAANVLFIA